MGAMNPDKSQEMMWQTVRSKTRGLLHQAAICAGPDPEQAARQLIDRLAPHLAPAQREHVVDHGRLVAEAAERIGRRLGLGEQRLAGLRLAGLLHDIGKCAMPEAILAAARPLTTDEREIIDTHAAIGAAVAARLGATRAVQEAVRDHHTTYGDAGLTWARPGAIARILAVADALVAMTSPRPYAPSRPPAEAMMELRDAAGAQFDPLVVETVIHMTPAHALAA
jgi:putative nucleotidyltransferase with HDIG domain